MKSLIRVAVLAAALVFASGPSTWAGTVLFPDGAFSEAFPFPGGCCSGTS